MALGKAMSGLAIGIGCRKQCSPAAIVELVQAALKKLPKGPAALFTIEDKAGQLALHTAANLLGLPLHFVSRAAMGAAMPRVQTRSLRALNLFGVASVAEAAALAGAGAGARLLVARITANGATCAVAGFDEGSVPEKALMP